MKKITLFTMNLEFGGIERYVATLADMFCQDFEVEIISTFKSTQKPAFKIHDSVKITYLIHEKPDNVSIKKLIKQKRLFSIIKEIIRRRKLKKLAIKRNKETIENINTDIIITARMYHSELVSKYCKNDTILKIATDHNYHQNDNKYIRSLIKSVRTFPYLIVSTEELLNSYKDIAGKTKVLLISNALPFISTEKTKFKTKNIISVGRFSPEKGFLDLIDIMNEIKKYNSEIKLNLLGDGFQNDEIQQKIDELCLRKSINTPGFVSQEEMKDYFLNSSLFIMTSYTEAFGLVLIEAMNYGLPCIAFDSASGPRSLLKNNLGVLVKNRDKEQFAKKIIDLINNKSDLKQRQRLINEEIKKYSLEETKKRWINLFNNNN